MRHSLTRFLVLAAAVMLIADCTSGSGLGTAPGQGPLLFEDFNPSDFNGQNSKDGVWHISGPWLGTYNNWMDVANTQLETTYNGQPGGYLLLTVPYMPYRYPYSGLQNCGGNATSDPCQGGEIYTEGTTKINGTDFDGQNLQYGYYEARMKVTSTPGVVVSFFWKQHSGTSEIDYEFLTNESWASNPSQNGVVYLTLHPSGGGNYAVLNLSFNPTVTFHRYGFLWTPTELQFVIDGAPVVTWTTPPYTAIATAEGGSIMMNTWTGDPKWGGGPPTSNATSEYDWVKYWPNLTSVPPE